MRGLRHCVLTVLALFCASTAAAVTPTDVGTGFTSSNPAGQVSGELWRGADRNLESPAAPNGIKFFGNHGNLLSTAPTCANNCNDGSDESCAFDSSKADGDVPIFCNGTTQVMHFPPSYDEITNGTNLNAHLVGNGGTLAPTGTGLITANRVPDGNTANLGASNGGVQVLDDGRYQWRDGLGVIRSVSPVFNVRDYGAACDGSTNDAAALNSAYAALPSGGGGIKLCPNMVIDSIAVPVTFDSKTIHLFADTGDVIPKGPIVISNQSGCSVYGTGSGFVGNATRFQWNGPHDPTTAPAIFVLKNTANCELAHFSIAAPLNGCGGGGSSPCPLLAGILSAKVLTGITQAPRDTIVYDVNIYGNSNELNVGVRLIGGVCLFGANANLQCAVDADCTGGVCTTDADDDDNTFTNVNVSNFTGAGISIEHSQSFGHRLNYVTTRANTGGGLCGASVGGGACTAGTAALIGNFCESNAACGGSGVCTRSATAGGAFTWEGGYGGGLQIGLVCNLGNASVQPLVIRDVQSESSQKIEFATGNTTSIENLIVSNLRWSANTANPIRKCVGGGSAGSTCANDGGCSGGFCAGCTASATKEIAAGVTVYNPCCTGNGAGSTCLKTIEHKARGTVLVSGSVIGDGEIGTATAGAYAFELNSSSGAGASASQVIGTTFFTTSGTPFQADFPTRERWETYGVLVKNPTAGTTTLFQNLTTAPIWEQLADSSIRQTQDITALTTSRTTTWPDQDMSWVSANTASQGVKRDASGNFTAGTITAALTGNASTATALAANPADCGANQYATTIAANGDLTCAQPSFSQISGSVTDAQVPDTITVNLAAAATALAANGTNCSAGSFPLGVDASGNAESCTVATTGTVTSVATGTGVTGGTITGSGTISLDYSNTLASNSLAADQCVMDSTDGGILCEGHTPDNFETVLKFPDVGSDNTVNVPVANGDTLVGKATTDTLTNKTFDTAGTGNSFKINGIGITAVSPAVATVVGNTRAINATAPIAGGGDLQADRTLTCNVASGSQPGCLASADWTTFNGKQAGPLTGDVTTSGAAATVVQALAGDSAAGTTLSGAKLAQRRANTCTTQTDGVWGQLCLDDAGVTWICNASGGCNAASWVSVGRIGSGTTPPATCGVGDLWYDTDAAVSSGARLLVCTTTNSWTGMDNPFGATIDPVEMTPRMDYPSSAIANYSAATVLLPASTTPPGTCEVGSIYLDTNATDDSRLLGCLSANVYTSLATPFTVASNTYYSSTLATVGTKTGIFVTLNDGSSSAVPVTTAINGTATTTYTNGNPVGVQATADALGGGLSVTGIQAFAQKTGSGSPSSVVAGSFTVKNLHASVAIPTGIGVSIPDMVNSGGGATTQIGLDIANQTVGTTKWSMRVGNANSYHIGNFMLGGTAVPTDLLDLDGQSARVVAVVRETTSNTAGNSLTINSGGATSAATDKAAGNLILNTGTGTGRGIGSIAFGVPMVVLTPAATPTAGGTADRAITNVMYITNGAHIEMDNTHVGAPWINSCGTGAVLSTGSTDTDGQIAIGTPAAPAAKTPCIVNFKTTWTNAPFCVVSWGAVGTPASFTPGASFTLDGTTSQLLEITNLNGAYLAGEKINYHCFGYQ